MGASGRAGSSTLGIGGILMQSPLDRFEPAFSPEFVEKAVRYGFLDANAITPAIYQPELINNNDDRTMFAAIVKELKRCDTFYFSVAFVTTSALALLKQHLLDFKGKGVIYTSTYLDFNEPAVFEELLLLENIEVRVLKDTIDAFHSKGYIFESDDSTTAIIGSSNLTNFALTQNAEWNMRFSALPDGDITTQLRSAIESLREDSDELTREWITHYEKNRKIRPHPELVDTGVEQVVPVGKIYPNKMQRQALENLASLWRKDESRAIIISATGTGKTILAALAARAVKPERMLFVVHREQILNKAIEEFKRVFEKDDEDFGKYVGVERNLEAPFVFSTIQTLSRAENVKVFSPDHFDVVIIDESHRAGAETYKKILEYLTPKHLIGLTATPERTDGFNIFELFDHNIAYEIRLQEALENKMLVPFSYYGIHEGSDTSGHPIGDQTSENARLESGRIDQVVTALRKYGHVRDARGLIFCSSKKEAHWLAAGLNGQIVYEEQNSAPLRVVALTGDDPMEVREATVAKLEAGELDYITTVDIFNEGIDIPCINQVVMMRETQSSIIFTQQLGRGLRKFAGKDHLRVLDFIGNYANNFHIPIALFGKSSGNKDEIAQRTRRAVKGAPVAGASSVSFDEIAQERIFESLAKAKIDSIARLKEDYTNLRFRLGQQPWRIDFARFDTLDPVAFSLSQGKSTSSRKGYWNFLKKTIKVDRSLTEFQEYVLQFLDLELLNGKRIHENVVFEHLLRHGNISFAEMRDLFESEKLGYVEATPRTVERILSLEFFVQPERNSVGNISLVSASGEDDNRILKLTPELQRAYDEDEYFRKHIDDINETARFLNQHRYNRADGPVIGRRYSRKDVCRLLNWANNEYSTMYGYSRDKDTNTCPIFVTYHKADTISASTQYEDEFLNNKTMSWYSKNKRSLARSSLERDIASGSLQLDLFVKKNDSEGPEFFYVGPVKPRDAMDTTIQSDEGKEVSIVNMKLDLAQPMGNDLLMFFETSAIANEVKESTPSGESSSV